MDSLRSDFEEDFPLLSDLMRTLFPVVAGGHTRRKELSFTHAISILMSLKDKDLRNDIKLCFSVLFLSYGVGCRLMNFLCKMSLTYNWETIGRYLDSYIENKLQYIKNDAPPEVPIILFIDNINMYRGNKKYHRLFKTFGPKIWNFTGRGVLIQNTDGLSDLFDDEETAAKNQKDLNDITFDDISLQLSHEHSETVERMERTLHS